MSKLTIYPHSFEEKIGFDAIRLLLKEKSRSLMGQEVLQEWQATADPQQLQERLERMRELLLILEEKKDIPNLALEDLRASIESIRPEGTYLSEEKLPHLASLINRVGNLYSFLGYQKRNIPEEEGTTPTRFPHLLTLLPEGLLLPDISHRIEELLDRFGRIKDTASPELATIRNERVQVERNISREVKRILAYAIEQGWAEEEARPTLRNGHSVIPVTPTYKRYLKGIVHDESSTGKTIFIEPIEIVEANNRIRELDVAERREIIRILIQLSNAIRPHISSILDMYRLVGLFDALFSMALFAQEERAVIPKLLPKPYLDWLQARHPVLRRTLEAEHRSLVPIDLSLQAPEGRILIISGPNAGGKSVCLKTCAMLQYMLQMGFPIPVHPDSTAGIFSTIAVNIGDDQSLEDDLSTYSSHLVNMRRFCALASPSSLLLIDEFGAGTEPELGGAIAESLLEEFNKAKSFGLITTHYRNLKQYATEHEGVVNGAMLYDRGEMRPLFKLSIGHPGSSFAIEIAKKSGLPKGVIEHASLLVGKELIDSDKYVQDIARDRRYWERKRELVRKREKELEESIERYQKDLLQLRSSKQQIIQEAREQAQRLLSESNAKIERTIREIKESGAERERTQKARQALESFSKEGLPAMEAENADNSSERIEREIKRLEKRNKRKEEKRLNPKQEKSITESPNPTKEKPIEVGCWVITPNGIEGEVLEIRGASALLALGGTMQTSVPLAQLKRSSKGKVTSPALKEKKSSNVTEHLHEKKVHFKQELDLRGMRALDAMQAVDYYLDEAIQVGCHRIRLLHGTGTGALRQSIRQLLATRPYVLRYYDEDVRLGGAGITIVEL